MKTKKIHIAAILLFAMTLLFAFPLFGQEVEHLSDVWKEFTYIPLKRVDRCKDIVEMFKHFGADEIYVEPIEGGRSCPGNIIVPLKSGTAKDRLDGDSVSYIIISAHLDMEGDGVGALDNYSGSLMMAALYKGLKGSERAHDFLFIAFDREEEGLLGSKAFVKKSRFMPKMPENIHAVINLECLGITLPHPWPEGSSDSLEDLFIEVGKRYNLDLSPVSIKNVRTDSLPFLEKGFPAITLDGIMPYDLFILGSRLDVPAVIDKNTFFQSYPILLEYILEVDALSEWPDPKNVR